MRDILNDQSMLIYPTAEKAQAMADRLTSDPANDDYTRYDVAVFPAGRAAIRVHDITGHFLGYL